MSELREVVVCSPLRTPVGRMGGVLAPVSALELATTVLRALLDRTGLDPAAVDGVIGAQGYPTMEAPAFGRVAARTQLLQSRRHERPTDALALAILSLIHI